MHDKNFIVVPYWAYEALRRAKLDLKTILDFREMRRVFSTADLAELLASQGFLQGLVGATQEFVYADPLYSEWGRVGGEDATFLNNTLTEMVGAETTRNSAAARLFAPETRRERDEKAFITYDISPTVGAVVVYPGQFVLGVQSSHQLSLLEEILKTFYVYQTHTEVARSPWFRLYLRALSQTATA